MDIKKELESTMSIIDTRLNDEHLLPNVEANLIIAKVNVLTALQKYEKAKPSKPFPPPPPPPSYMR